MLNKKIEAKVEGTVSAGFTKNAVKQPSPPAPSTFPVGQQFVWEGDTWEVKRAFRDTSIDHREIEKQGVAPSDVEQQILTLSILRKEMSSPGFAFV